MIDDNIREIVYVGVGAKLIPLFQELVAIRKELEKLNNPSVSEKKKAVTKKAVTKKEVYKTSFADVKEAAEFFGVNPSTIHKWLGYCGCSLLNADWDVRKAKWVRIRITSTAVNEGCCVVT